MNYTIDKIADITKANLLASTDPSFIVEEIVFDTRRGTLSDHAMFIAIAGINADGHEHVSKAYHDLGIRNFLISRKLTLEEYPGSNFLLVPDTVKALQQLATHHRNGCHPQVMGITGSNGKTIVKEWIYQIMEPDMNIVRSPGSYNSQIGVPLSVLRINSEHELAIIEAGISHLKEMSILEQIIQPDFGIMTNIGPAHSAGFANNKEKLKEKLKLFNNVRTILYRADYKDIDLAIRSNFPNKKIISWSSEKRSDVSYFIQREKSDGGNEKIHVQGMKDFQCEIPFNDDLAFENAVFAIIASLELGTTIGNVVSRTLGLKPIGMRLEIKKGINDCLLINDTYNSDLYALSSALNILSQQGSKKNKTLILSQIEESEHSAQELNIKIAELIKKHDINKIIGVGSDLYGLKVLLPSGVTYSFFSNTDQLLTSLFPGDFIEENILIKGARKYNLEQVFDRLSVKVHQTVLEINMEALRHNLSVYRSFLKKGTKLMVVLKASAYGSGGVELARFLSFQHVDYIAVAYIDEGVEMRKAGIQKPIMVMNPEEAGFRQLIEYGLEPEIYSVAQLKGLINELNGRDLGIHLKIETGMHRLGFEEEAIPDLIQILGANPNLKIRSVFSHLVGSDDPQLDEFSILQISIFERIYRKITTEMSIRPDRHILNSNGISRFSDYQFEMVRLGIGLHGVTDNNEMDQKLQKVQTLKTRIAQIKRINPKESVGYNRNFIAQEPMTIGTINIGYADGLPRIAGNGRFAVLCNGKAAPIIGNICMDMCMINLNGIQADEGDEVIIFGPEWPISKLAEVSQTIPYEILTRLSTRIHRIFTRE